MKLIHLSDRFYADYAGCEEILKKDNRPYACLEVKIDDLTFAIPLRHHIRHKYAFTTMSPRGLDYTKAVIITGDEYIADTDVWIDSEEYAILRTSERQIARGMAEYYRLYLKAKAHPDNRQYQSILRYSSLQYFDK